MANDKAHTITFYPLGNADTARIDLGNGKKVLFDYANTRCDDDEDDKRIDLPTVLRDDLKAAKKTSYDVVAITHLDWDHTCGADEFFWFDHAKKYQGGDRVKIDILWVPSAVITESQTDLEPAAAVIQTEARYRLEKGYGIRVFSRPAALESWLKERGLTLESRKALITDAGQVAPEFSLPTDGVEFFVHSPFAWRQEDNTVVDRNRDCIVMQVVFEVSWQLTKAILTSDATHETLSDIVRATRRPEHNRPERLEWHIYKIAHHCSYLSLGPDKGEDKTKPTNEIKWMLETQGQQQGIQVASSDPIPAKGTDEDKDPQPPHRQAHAYYKDVQTLHSGELLVTMSHPENATTPEPIVITIDGQGFTLKKPDPSSAAIITSARPPRAGNETR